MNRSMIFALALLAPAAVAAQQPAVTYRTLADMDTSFVGNNASPNGRFILLNNFEVLDVRTGRRTSLGKGVMGAWSPRGDLIAFSRSTEDGSGAQVWTVPVDPERGTPTGSARRVSLRQGVEPFFSGDGRSILYFTRSGDTSSIVEIPATGGPERVVYREPGFQFRWGGETPDGRWIYFQDWPTGHYWKLRVSRIPGAGGVRRTIVRHLAHYSGLSRDGRYLAYFPEPGPFNMRHPLLVITDLDGHQVARIRMPWGSAAGAWGPGHTMVYVRWNGLQGIHEFDLRTGAMRVITPYSALDSHPAYSPDGRELAVARPSDGRFRLTLLPTDGGPARVIHTSAEPENASFHWSPDGSAIAFLTDSEPREFEVVNVTTGQETMLHGQISDDRWAPMVWRRDGRAILYVSGQVGDDGSVREVSLGGSDREVRRIDIPASTHDGAVAAFAGDSALVVLSPGALRVLDFDGGERTLATPPVEDVNGDVAVSPDGHWVVYATPENTGPNARDMYAVVPLGGGESRTLPLGSPCWDLLAWHPDSKHVAVNAYASCADYTPRVYLLPINGDAPRLLSANDSSSDFDDWSFSPDGTTLAIACEAPGQQFAMPATIMAADLSAVLAAADKARRP